MKKAIVVGLCALGALVLAGASQPETSPTARPSRPGTGRPVEVVPTGKDVNELWLPPGQYSAIVVSTSATERTWWLSLDTLGGSFPITIGPQQTVTIDFDPPWTVGVDTNARLTSRYVPFGDYTEFNPLNNQRVQLFAWGITTAGPVQLVPPKLTK